jgi:hypothetical protein
VCFARVWSVIAEGRREWIVADDEQFLSQMLTSIVSFLNNLVKKEAELFVILLLQMRKLGQKN